MKKIVLIGDSIRMGYDKYVRDAMQDIAQVLYPSDNCRFVSYVLRYAHVWQQEGYWGEDADAVHWNAGLWDVVELYGDAPLSPIAYYEDMVLRIHNRLRRLFPQAKIVFATSTPVDESANCPTFARHNEIIRAYNAAAVRVLSKTDAIINDLYGLAEAFPTEYRSDSVHFYTPEATARLGGQVLSVLCDCLSISPAELHLESHEFVCPPSEIAQM